MENQEVQKSKQKKLLTREDCKRDRKHFYSKDEYGNEKIEEIDDELLAEWKEEDVGCDELFPADRERCRDYYFYDYDEELLEEYYRQKGEDFNINDSKYALWGLVRMFNDKWLKSPAFVDWDDMRFCISENKATSFIHNIINPETREQILNYLIKIIDSICAGNINRHPWNKKVILAIYKRLKEESKAAAKVEKQELAKQKTTEKQATKKNNSDYVVTADEIINYACQEAGEHQYAIVAMLRYFCFQKPEWDNSTLRKKIRSIGTKIEINIHNKGTLNQISDSDVSINK